MYCARCGRQNADDARHCVSCGAALDPGAAAPPPGRPPGAQPPPGYGQGQPPPAFGQQPPTFGQQPGQRPPAPGQPGWAAAAQSLPNYLVQAILTTIFCCQPFGIVAIVFAAQVNSKLTAGDVAGAQQASKNAKTWCWAAFITGAIPIVAFTIFFAVSAILTAVSES